MKNKKQPDVINRISMTIEEFYDLHRKVTAAYYNAGSDDITPDDDFEHDTIDIINKNGDISASIFIKLSTRESIEII